MKRLGRNMPRVAAIGAALAALVVLALQSSMAPAAVGVFSLDRLRLGDASGPENYIYTAGNTVFPDGGVDPGTYYKFVVKDPAGTVRNPSFPCTPAGSFTSADNRYTVQPSDPASTGTAWKFTLNQYTSSSCTGAASKTITKNFHVAKVSTYSDSALTTPSNVFPAGGTAYVTVAGAKPGLANWNVTWLLPSGAVACANTAGNDRPESSGTGLLPKAAGTFLQFPPNTTAIGSAWNRNANYETRPCPAFSSANAGTWSLRIDQDATDFVVLSPFSVDATPPPAPSIVSGPSGTVNTASASLGFSDSETGVSFLCQLDGGGFASCTSPKSYSALADGSHSFQVKARDAAGNDSTVTTRSWTVDTTAPPAPSINSGPTGPVNSASASFGFSDTETGVSFLCQLDGAGFSACTSPQSYSGLADGSHSFQVKARDAAGNDSPITTRSWTVDTTPPPAPSIDSGPSDPSNSTSPSFSFSDNEGGVSFLCQVDSGGFSACTSPKSYSLADGSHSFQVKARDAAGNDSSVTTRSWTIVTSGPPAPTIDSAPSDPSNSSAASFSFSDSQAGVSFFCQLDANGFSACTSPKSYSSLGDGLHTFQVKARDAAGNDSAVTTRGWTIDTTPPPAPSIDSGPSGTVNSGSPSFGFSDTETGVSFLCQLDGAGFSACTSPKSYSGLGEGLHSFQVKARDAAGNDSTISTRAWTIDTTPPPAPSIDSGPSGTVNSGSASFAFSDTEIGVSFLCQVDGAGFSSCTSPKSYSALGDGSHSFQVKARDAAGNDSTVSTGTWTIDTTPPPAPSIDSGPSGTTSSTSASFGFSDTEAGVSFLCQLDSGGFSSCTSPQSYSALADGTHSFQVKARDAVGNDSTISTRSWTVDTTPPPVPSIDSAPSDPSSTSSASFGFSDTEFGVSFLCQLDGGGFSACTSPKSYSGLSEGSHTFQVEAVDGAGNTSSPTSRTWTISLPPITLDSPAGGSFTNDPTPTFSGIARTNVGDGPTVSVAVYAGTQASGQPVETLVAAVQADGSYSVNASPALADGTFTAQASQSSLSGMHLSSANTFPVDTTPAPAPSIDSGPSGTVSSTSASFGFSDTEAGVSFLCQLDGAGFSSCTSPKSYSGLGDGSHSFQVKARDAAGNDSTITTRSWTIDTTPPPAPSIDSGPSGTVSSTSASFGFSDTETGASFLCQLDGSGFSACTSPKSYSALADGSHSFQVKARDAAGNDSTVATRSWTVDTTPPPAPSIDSGPSGTVNTGSASFSFSDSQTGVSFLCQLDGAGFSSCTSPKSYSGLADGSHSFQVKARDAGGNDSAISTRSWIIDTAPPPAPSIDSGPSDPSNSTSPSFGFSDTEAGVSFLCQLDGAGFSSCSSPKSYTGLGEGLHSFQVKARDAAGNDSTVTTRSWTIVTTGPPAPSIDSGPSGTVNTGSASFSFSDSQTGVSFLCQLDGGGFSACTSPQSYSGLSEGSHSFQVKARDAAGNDSTVTTRSWTIDTTPPPAPSIDSGPSGTTSSTSASLGFSDTETGDSFLCQLDGAAFGACTSPKSYSALGDGSHSFQVKARDSAGNDSTVSSRTWTVDTTAPAVTLAFPANGTTVTSATPTFSGNAGNATGDGATVTVRVYSGTSTNGSLVETLTATRQLDTSWSVPASPGLADGTYTAQATQSDSVGNAGQSAPSTFTVAVPTAPSNTSAPTISGTAQENQTLTASPGTWSGTQPISYAYQWRQCDSSGNNCSDISGQTAQSYVVRTADIGQTIRVAVTASNSVGQSTAASAQTSVVTAAPVAPSNTAPPTISGTAQENQTLNASPGTWSGTQPISYAYQWRQCNSSGNNCSDVAGETAQSYVVRTADIGKTLRVVVNASNTAGSSSATSAQTAVVTSAVVAPTNTSPPTISGTAQDGQTLTAATGTWSGTAPISYAYQWRRCDSSGLNCADVQGATTQTFLLSSTDVGKTLRVVVTASNTGGSNSATSAQTAVVTGIPPTNTAAPTISGTFLQQRQTLTASPGTWSGTQPISYSYQWQRCGYVGPVKAEAAGYWRLDENAGTTAADLSGNGNNGTYESSFTLGQPGALNGDSDTAVRFQPSTGGVDIPGSASLNYGDNVTYEVWLKLLALPPSGTTGNIMSKSSGTAAFRVLPTGQLMLRKSGATDIAGSTVNLSVDNSFHYIVMTKNGPSVHIYVDGVDVTGPVSNLTLTNNTADLAISHHPFGTSDALNAVVDEAAVYSHALTAGQVASHYAAGTSGGGCVNISGATGQSYTIASGDVGSAMRVVVTASNSGGSSTANSAQTQPISSSVGFKDRSFSGAGGAPTGSKPESKLWWNDGRWWASMWNGTGFDIFKLDTATQTWSDTGTQLDPRSGTRADTLWDGTHLYVASHVFSTCGCSTSASGFPSRLYRYSYNSATKTYSLDSGFPVQINNTQTETLVIDKDSTGTLWATWAQDSQVMVTHTVGGNDQTWVTPYVLPGTAALNLDDISTLVAFGGNKVGVFWSNQVTSSFYFAYHVDGQADSAWTIQTAASSPSYADDHINLKADANGRVYAAVKTSLGDGSNPDPNAALIALLVRDPSTGAWSRSTVWQVSDGGLNGFTRPILEIDTSNQVLHIFGASSDGGGAIYEKTSPMGSISFAAGNGTPFIVDGGSLTLNNSTSTKQFVTTASGLAVLCGSDGTSFYWHNFVSLP
jgi:hypothetical protein